MQSLASSALASDAKTLCTKTASCSLESVHMVGLSEGQGFVVYLVPTVQCAWQVLGEL